MRHLTLDDVEALLREPRPAGDLFAAVSYRELARATHPDRYPGDSRAEALFRRLQDLHAAPGDPPVSVKSPKRTYLLQRLLAVGDVADVHLATPESALVTDAASSYALKVSRIPEGHTLLNNERKVLTHLLTAAGDATYHKYLPTLAESFPVRDRFPKRVNVFLYEAGCRTLEQVHEQQPALDARHLGWIFKRLLTVLGYCHRQGTVHGAVLPCHVLIDAANHGVRLIGWGHSVRTNEPIRTLSTRYQSWYPGEVLKTRPAVAATDLFLAARCLVYLAGGEPARDRLPDTVPIPMQRFLKSCLLEGASMRPHDAWALLEEFDELLRQLYGPPRFHPLTIT